MTTIRLARSIACACVLAVWSTTAASQSLHDAQPDQVGLSAERLARIDAFFTGEVRDGRLPGAVVLVVRKGRIAHFKSFGYRDKPSGAPMTNDAIFRIYSMTKPITSVAVMMLAEEGRLALTDPVTRFLPSLGKREVSVATLDPGNGALSHTRVAATRDITVQDLLRHTSGLTYGNRTTNSEVRELYRAEGIEGTDLTNAGLIERLSKVPLVRQPGTAFEYSHSTDVLGRVVEVVAKTTLAKFFADRIFAPLRMTDSGFHVPERDLRRLAEPFSKDPVTGEAVSVIDVTKPPTYESGGGGAVSTALDYARFCQMLLNGGQLDGLRLVSRTTIDLMTADHLGAMLDAALTPSDVLLGTPGYTFGLGFAVRKEAGIAAVVGSAGEYTWGGAAGTHFWIDPKEDLIGILMAATPGPARVQYRKLFRHLVYQAIVD